MGDREVVPICQCDLSAFDNPLFINFKQKAQLWLSDPTPPDNKAMDSVFFNEQQFELLVDTRGFKPEEVKCTVGPTGIQIVTESKEIIPNRQRSMATTRSYQLPQNVNPQQACCYLSPEGFLLLIVPWQNS